jgi:polyribonucleotide nucleotidyltransferase
VALQDAGVPIRRRVAGVAMGLVLDDAAPEGAAILTDILGLEDALGDMDFKVAGDADSISALQMDIKVEGITVDIMRRALAAARSGRRHILQQMDACKPPPRRTLSPYCPRILELAIPDDQIGPLIGSGGASGHTHALQTSPCCHRDAAARVQARTSRSCVRSSKWRGSRCSVSKGCSR